jgi:hypothetical protein
LLMKFETLAVCIKLPQQHPPLASRITGRKSSSPTTPLQLLALLNSPYLPLLLTNVCALCLFHCCHITVVCHTSCRLQWHVDRLYLLSQNEATQMVLTRSAAAIKILLMVYFLFFAGGWHVSCNSGLYWAHHPSSG